MRLNLFLLCIAAFSSADSVIAQAIDPEERTILAADSAFWKYYNACDVDAMKNYVTDDFEFYHDKGGFTKGIDDFVSKTRKNLCGNDNFRLRREPVPGSVKVYLLKNDGKTYGAILSGQHVFYIIKDGKAPRLDGLARFTHLFVATESGWKMSRVLSYDHGPAQYVNHRIAIVLNKGTLDRFVGTYRARQSGNCIVTLLDNNLKLVIGDNTYTLIPESTSTFFQEDRDLTFEFKENKMIVREFGDVVEEAVRSK